MAEQVLCTCIRAVGQSLGKRTAPGLAGFRSKPSSAHAVRVNVLRVCQCEQLTWHLGLAEGLRTVRMRLSMRWARQWCVHVPAGGAPQGLYMQAQLELQS